MPESLRAARAAKGWSQSRLIYEIELYARHRAIAVAGTPSLKVYVSEWENGRRAVSAPYAGILRVLFGMTDAELFDQQTTPALQVLDGYTELVTRVDAARSVGRSAVDAFLVQTEAFRTIDRQMGAARLVDSMDQHITTISDALAFTVLPDARRPLAEALCGAATLAAWEALDVGATPRAWRRYELAKQAAREAEQPRYLAHAMGEQAYVLADAGQPALALQLVEAALEIRGGVPPRLTAWLLSALAEMHALNGDTSACRRALDQAAQVVPTDRVLRDPEVPSIFLTEEHLTRWRGHSLALVGDEQAVSDLYGALGRMDTTFARAQAGLHCDLAQAHLVRREFSDAADHLRSARQLANRTGSIRYRRRADDLTYRLPS
jgi:transcriptional regulator with XRE-family HTH domain